MVIFDFIFYSSSKGEPTSNRSFLGNEFLVDQWGLDGGTCILLNSGCMSTSAGPMSGFSKSTALAYIIMNFDIPYAKAVNMGGAWTSVSLTDIPCSRIPIMFSLAQACDEKFWVSNHFLYGGKSDKSNTSRLVSMRASSDKLSCRMLD